MYEQVAAAALTSLMLLAALLFGAGASTGDPETKRKLARAQLRREIANGDRKAGDTVGVKY